MLSRLNASKQRQTAINRVVFCCGCAGFSFVAIVWFGLLQKIQAAENTLPRRLVAAAPTKVQPKLVARYGKLPLSFEANRGQTDSRVRFLARGGGYTIFLTADEAVLALQKSSVVSGQSSVSAGVGPPFRSAHAGVAPPFRSAGAGVAPTFRSAGAGLKSGATTSVDKPTTDRGPRTTDSVLRMKLVGANARAAVTGADELPGKSNYFIGNDPKKWRTNVPSYRRVKYEGVYPGVDLVYYGNQRQLEYDFVVAPGADPNPIKLSFAGADGMRVDAASGDLVVKVGDDEVRIHKPAVYQPTVAAVLRPTGSDPDADLKVRATLERPSPQPRIPNPDALSGTFVLASSNEVAFRVAGYDPHRALVIDPVLIYSTYLGGSVYDQGNGIAVDSSGSAYVTGLTQSPDFPTNPTNQNFATTGGQPNANGLASATQNAFVTKLDPTGQYLVYSTYLGGGESGDSDQGNGIAVDSFGNAYVTGLTSSLDFPTVNAYQNTNYAGPPSATTFVAKLNPTGSALIYSTYLGGSYYDQGNGIAVDSSGHAYVTGYAWSTNFPTVNPYQGSIAGPQNAFVTKLSVDGTGLVYSTYLGGSSYDQGNGIAVDSFGNAYVTGFTESIDFPLSNPYQKIDNAQEESDNPTAFVAKLSWSSPVLTLVYSTYLGGSIYDQGNGIAVDSSGNAYVTGFTQSPDFPTTTGAGQTALAGSQNAFVTQLNPAGSSLVYSTYLGGSGSDSGQSIAVDSSGNAYVTGSTSSTDFPTVKAVQPNYVIGVDVFVTQLNATGSALVYSTYLGGAIAPLADQGNGIAIDSQGNTYVTGMTNSTQFPTVNAFQPSNPNANPATNSTAFVAKIPPTVSVGFSPTTGLAFGPQTVGTASALVETVTNTGAGNLIISSVTIGGTNASDFVNSADTCTGATVIPNGTCTVSVTFTPSATGSRSASLIFTDNAFDSPETVGLTGTGTAPVASVSPTSLPPFGNQMVGTASAPQQVTLSNTTGTAALTINLIAASANFAVTTGAGACAGSVAIGGSCTIYVTFSPTATGLLSGTLTITDNSNGVAGSTQTVTLSGTGTAPLVSLLTPSLSLGNQLLSTTSAAQAETVTNTGTANLTISTVTLGGTNASDFAKSADTCTGTTVTPNGTCTVSVTFTPAATGARSGTLTFTDNNNSVAGSTQAVALSGVGVDFGIGSLTPTQSVGQGGQAVYTINVTSVGGTDSNAATLGCSNLPAQATCAFSPTTVTPGASGGSSTLTITTTAPVYARMLPPSTGRPPAALPALLLAAMLPVLVGWWRVRRKSPRWAAATCLLFGALLATTFMAGCGAGGYLLPKVGGTPVGLYTITVTATFGSTSHTTTITLNVTAS